MPEALLLVGIFADWFEFRIVQDTLRQRQTVDEVTTTANGAKDLYLWVKLALTEQKGWLPATVVIPQMTVPTGSAEVTAGRILPGVNVDFGWEVIKDLFSIEMLIANNFVQDDLGGSSHQEGELMPAHRVSIPLPLEQSHALRGQQEPGMFRINPVLLVDHLSPRNASK